MNKKTDETPFPDIDLDAAEPTVKPGAPGRPPRLRSQVDLGEDDALLGRAARSSGLPSSYIERHEERSPTKTFTVELPVDVIRQIKMKAAETDTPIRVLVMRALRAGGFDVKEADMTDERGAVLRGVSQRSYGGRGRR